MDRYDPKLLDSCGLFVLLPEPPAREVVEVDTRVTWADRERWLATLSEAERRFRPEPGEHIMVALRRH